MLRRQLGAELRRLRERVGRTVGEVARELGWSESKLSRVETQVVPGLIQTAEYTSAIMQAELADDRPEIIGQRVQVRMARQAVLTRNPPPELWAVMDEDVVRRPIGGRDVLRRQLLRLAEVS